VLGGSYGMIGGLVVSNQYSVACGSVISIQLPAAQ
jgi:hypothetical protein